MRFIDIPGQEELKNRLREMVKKDQIPHAMLFAGKLGAPNLAISLALATYINCENRGDNDACGECSSCTKALKYIHPDIHYVFPINTTPKVNVKREDLRSTHFYNEWREYLQSNPFGYLEDWTMAYGGSDKQGIISVYETRDIIKRLSLASFEGKYKILILWLPEAMNISAANAFLKFLEEPPAKTVILLVSNNEEQLLTTITSRAQRIGVSKFTDEEVMGVLSDAGEAASQIAHLADGDLRLAMSLQQEIENDTHGWVRDWLRLCFTRKFEELSHLSEDFHAFNKIQRRSVLNYASHIIRESLVSGTDDSISRVQGEELEFATNFKKVLTVDRAQILSENIDNSLYHLERNGSGKMIFMSLSIRASEIFSKN